MGEPTHLVDDPDFLFSWRIVFRSTDLFLGCKEPTEVRMRLGGLHVATPRRDYVEQLRIRASPTKGSVTLLNPKEDSTPPYLPVLFLPPP